ncbi:MAG: hypothetical protein N2Z60_05700, partial [Elusimicrobiales bacterium]|nr:hypothetical protein [Elusimicrobiales bacterium]
LLEHINELYSFYSQGIIPVLFFNIISLLLVYFIDKSFFLPFIYGALIFLLFVFLDVFLNYILSLYFYPHIISDQKHKEMKNSFVLLKGLVLISLTYILFVLFSRFLNKMDYIVAYAGVCFSALSVYISSLKYRKINYFFNLSCFSFIFVLSLLLFMRFGYLKYLETLTALFFVYYIAKTVNSISGLKVGFIKSEKISEIFVFFISYFLFSLFVFLNQYQNMYLFFAHIFYFFIFYFVLRVNLIGFSKIFLVLLIVFLTKTISGLSLKMIDGFTSENIYFFLLFSILAVLFDYLKEAEFSDLVDFNKNFMKGKWDKTLDINNLKIPFVVNVLFFYLVFSYMYNLMNAYYGYSDNFDFLVLIISVSAFYFYESFSDKLLFSIEKSGLNFIYNISVLIFVFSFIIVLISYSVKIGFTNLYGSYLIFAFLAAILSKKYYSYLISVFYLSLFYILSYVRG